MENRSEEIIFKNTILSTDGSRFVPNSESIVSVCYPKSLNDFFERSNTKTVLVGHKGT